MEYDVLYKNTYERKNIMPINPPHNLKKIKNIFNLTDCEFAKNLNIKDVYFSLVANNKVTFSGKNTIKLLNNLNIPFSLLYNIDNTTKTSCKQKMDSIYIMSCRKDCKRKDLYSIISSLIKRYNISENAIVAYYEITKKNNTLKIDLSTNKSNHLSITTKNKYKNELKKIYNVKKNIDLINWDENKKYYLIGIQHEIVKDINLSIHTDKNIDVETCKLLNKFPFKKPILISIPEPASDGDAQDYLYLDKEYLLFINNNLIKTNKILKKDCSYNNGYYTFFALSNKTTLNKLQIYRYLKGYSAEYMADFFGVLPSSYRLMEGGFNSLSTQQMWLIENKLGILLENILDIKGYYLSLNS